MRTREVVNKISIAPQAVLDAYQKNSDAYHIPSQVELRMIVIHCGMTAEEKVLKRKQAKDICGRLLAGERFDELARQVSEGSKAAEGGYVGWIEPGSRRPEFGRNSCRYEARRDQQGH